MLGCGFFLLTNVSGGVLLSMKKKDAQDYRDAAELIASKRQEFVCHALEFTPGSTWNDGVNRPDLVKPFREIFDPLGENSPFSVFWDADAEEDCVKKTNSYDHSRECRIFALLLMAEMIENP